MAICPSCGEENPDKFRLCGFCGTPLKPAAPPEEERKQITVLFVDMVGSTSRGEELDPEDVRALLEPYYARLRAALERHGGTVEKFIGDAVVAVFGAPVAHEDDPERAVRAGLAILNEIGKLNEEDPSRRLEVRVGINTGEALVALGARVGEGEGMAWGDVMNTAARIQSAAPVNGVLVDERTRGAAEKAIAFEAAEPIAAKGKSAPVPVAVVVGTKEHGDEDAEPDTPFVGREGELDQLLSAWRSAAEAKPVLAMLVGPPGAGKTRLLAEFRRRVPEAAVHVGRCLSYGEGITYAPITEIVRTAAGIRAGDDDELLATKLAALIESLPTEDLDQLRTVASALANLVGVQTSPRGTYTAAAISQPELHWGIRRFLELLAEERPVVLVVEDVHWAEPTMVELVGAIAEDAVGRILMLVTSRPELPDIHPQLVRQGERRLVLTLEPLGDDESRELLTKLLEDVPADAVERLIHNAGGNPLFLEETARMLAESGGVAGEAAVPTSLQGLVGARLDALDSTEKRVAQHSSVAGGEFWSGVVRHLEDGTQRDGQLEALERRDFVRERKPSAIADEREWAFKHAVVREVAYGSLPKGRRVGLHVRFAEWVRALAASGDEHVEVLAYHLEQACRLARGVSRTPVPPPIEEAVEALRRAGERSEAREGVREARRYYERALAVVADDDVETRVELQLRRARALTGLGELAAAAEALREVDEQASVVKRLDLRCEALIGRANVAAKLGNAEEARQHVEIAETLASALGDGTLRIRAAYEAATGLAHSAGDHDGALKKLGDGLALAEGAADHALQIEGHMRLGAILFNLAELGSAEEHLERCLVLAHELGSLKEEARASYYSAYLAYQYRGDLDEAERVARQTAQWLERTGDALFEIQNLRLLAVLALARRDVEEAEELLKQALPLALERMPLFAAEIYRLFVEALVAQDRVEDARDLAEFAVRDARENDLWSAHATLASAFVAAASGDAATAAAEYATALNRLVDAKAWIDVIEARIAFARIAALLGNVATHADELARAREECGRIVAPGLAALVDDELANGSRGPAAPAPNASTS